MARRSVFYRAAELVAQARRGCCGALADAGATREERRRFLDAFFHTGSLGEGGYWWAFPVPWYIVDYTEPSGNRISQERAQTARVIALLLMDLIDD